MRPTLKLSFVMVCVCVVVLVGCTPKASNSTSTAAPKSSVNQTEQTGAMPAPEKQETVPSGPFVPSVEEKSTLTMMITAVSDVVLSGRSIAPEVNIISDLSGAERAQVLWNLTCSSSPVWSVHADLPWPVENSVVGGEVCPLELGKSAYRSYFGVSLDSPDSLDWDGFKWNDNGWTTVDADGGSRRDAYLSSFARSGKTISFDAVIVNQAGFAPISTDVNYFHMEVEEDAASEFGYHMVSMSGFNGIPSAFSTATASEIPPSIVGSGYRAPNNCIDKNLATSFVCGTSIPDGWVCVGYDTPQLTHGLFLALGGGFSGSMPDSTVEIYADDVLVHTATIESCDFNKVSKQANMNQYPYRGLAVAFGDPVTASTFTVKVIGCPDSDTSGFTMEISGIDPF